MERRRLDGEEVSQIIEQYEWSYEKEDYLLTRRVINPDYHGPEIVDPKTGELFTEFRMSKDEKQKLKIGKRWARSWLKGTPSVPEEKLLC